MDAQLHITTVLVARVGGLLVGSWPVGTARKSVERELEATLKGNTAPGTRVTIRKEQAVDGVL